VVSNFFSRLRLQALPSVMPPKRKSSGTTAEAGEVIGPNASLAASEHEQLCLQHAQRTGEYLTSLGLDIEYPVSPAVDSAPSSKRPRTQDDVATPGVDTAQGDEETRGEDVWRSWLVRSRGAVLAPGLGGQAPDSPSAWREEAVKRWGDAVPEQAAVGDWSKYVQSRLAVPPPPSPLDLMQERYAYDPWRLLVSCLLMARINSERVKSKTIASFFQRFPTPSSFLAVAGDVAATAAQQELQELLRPVGLVDNRVKSLLELTRAFLQMPVFDCGLQKNVNKIWGCGPFAVDSYLIFCCSQRLPETADATCKQYLDWWRKEVPVVESSPPALLETPEKSKEKPASKRSQMQQPAAAAPTKQAVSTNEPAGSGLHKFFKVAAQT